MSENALTEKIIGAAIEVHRHLGPGLLESAYEECLCYELALAGLSFQRQVRLPVRYKGLSLDCGYKMDLVVQDAIVVELKAIDGLLPVHSAQLLTYLRSAGKQVGLLINFNVEILKAGIKRVVNHYSGPEISSASSSVPPRLRDELEPAPQETL
ncbi:MAG: GxxExxY protein [Candidatus Sulfopaludibacter sp.]|nr:GxxExxY protein [Candidatus Sulfopaludibacter sp.]